MPEKKPKLLQYSKLIRPAGVIEESCRGCQDPVWWVRTLVREHWLCLDAGPTRQGSLVLVPHEGEPRSRQAQPSDIVSDRYRVHQCTRSAGQPARRPETV